MRRRARLTVAAYGVVSRLLIAHVWKELTVVLGEQHHREHHREHHKYQQEMTLEAVN